MRGRNGRGLRRGGGSRAFALLPIVLLALSAAFTGGVLVGRRWAASPPPRIAAEAKRPAPPTRRALGEVAPRRPPPIEEKLTFYQTLTAPLAAPPPRPVPPAPAPPAKEGAPAREAPYAVQVVAYRARPAAEEMERRLRAAGFDAYVVSGAAQDGAPTYRVRVGRFWSRAEAERLAQRLRQERGLTPFVAGP